ncbi:HXXEE domain-containing protein [Paenibacillus profundus]|uniref:HXXEE domain-containing protein n=1 Tax=Paenibacillus profundus TaxID=1173085 RepID=A0ABS8YCW2_9BACL|nr:MULTISPECIES: HXXEE domain-containing protein [Paenibacillus]MCE5169863.1 HXXEE domain-containing protein [Paenibacillus profundus]MCM3342157.1 HXXEE domain-containing protein [Paenibacillus sp. MER TA 81-3]
MSSSILILFLFAITIHNLEEAVWLIRQSLKATKVKMHAPVKQDQFLFGLFVVTALAYLITVLYIFYPSNVILKYAYFGFLGSMIFNIIFPHLISTIIERCYSPGLLTGIGVIIPTNLLILKAGFDTNTITVTNFIVGTICVGVILLSTIPLYFKIGKKLITY